MVVTIKKMGNLEKTDAGRIVDFRCDRCDCEFDATYPDYAQVHDQRDGDYFSSTCPFCQNAVTKAFSRAR